MKKFNFKEIENCEKLLYISKSLQNLERRAFWDITRYRVEWSKVRKKGPSKICGRQPLKFEVIWSPWHEAK